MPQFSILTNAGAQSALLNLNNTLRDLDNVQTRINTGLKVSSAKDNAATFTIALGMRSDVSAFKQVQETLNVGNGTLGVATAAASKIADEISTIKDSVIQASGQDSGRAEIQLAIDSAITSIKSFVQTSTFAGNGVNLLDGAAENRGTQYEVVSSLVRDSGGAASLSKLSVDYQDLSIEDAGRGLGDLLGLNVVEGKSQEDITTRNDPLSATITLQDGSGDLLVSGEEFSFSYKDANGQTQTLTFNTADSSSGNFSIRCATGGGATTSTRAAEDLANALTNLTGSGGALEGLGFNISSTTTGTSVTITRDPAFGPGEIIGFNYDSNGSNTVIDNNNFALQESHGGAAAIELTFNGTSRLDISDGTASKLEAGDTVDVSLTNANTGITQTFQFVVGAEGETVTNGASIAGTANKFSLNYADVVGNTTTAKTVDDVASVVAAALVDNTANQIGAEIDAFLGGNIGNGTADSILVQHNVGQGKVVLVDNLQAASNNDRLANFNMASAPGGILDFDAILSQVDAAESVLKTATANLGSMQRSLESQSAFMEELISSVNTGIGDLVDANMAEESARFQALQVQQQLGLQALSIANSQPQSVLSLFG